MKKKKPVTKKDKEDWTKFTENLGTVYDKDSSFHDTEKNNKIKKLDLHGFSLDEANKEVKNFIINSYQKGYRKLTVITGKGKRSKIYSDPYISNQMGVLKNSIPEFILNDSELSTLVNDLKKAEIKDGGEGAIYINLKKL